MDISSVYLSGFQLSGEALFTPLAVFGFSSEDVWIVGQRESPDSVGARVGFVLRKKGIVWEGVILPGSDSHTKVWGRSPDDVWIGGFGGRTYHFDGVNYVQFQLPDSAIVHQIIGPPIGSDVYASCLVPLNGPDAIRYYHWNGSQWEMTDSKTVGATTPAMSSVCSQLDANLISVDVSKITKRLAANSWQTVFEDPTAYFWDVWFRSGNEGFAIGTDTANRELVHHYDGNSWKRIVMPGDVAGGIVEVWSCQTTAMFVSAETIPQGSPWPKSFVIRGQ